MYRKPYKITVFLLIFFLLITIAGNFEKLESNSKLSSNFQSKNDVIPIIDLHNNDASGVPALFNQVVTISGEVTVANQFGGPSYIEDETAGVAVYDGSFSGAVNIGDFVTISGTVDHYYGLTELKSVTIIEHIAGSPSVVPQVITCFDIETEGTSGVENFEGELVRINSVTVNTDNWNVSTSGANFTLSDATGSCEIRIDKDTEIANTIAPDSNFDVIGVLSQFKYNSPYTSGYQLMPRFNNDIILLAGPRLLSGPEEKDMTANSMLITWITATPANSIVMYGKTDSYEIDSLTVEEAVTQHQALLTGLSPATIYHVKVGSADETGANFSADHIVITASEPSSTGEINVYFNKSVDQSYASSGNEAAGMQDLEQKFIDRINAANYSIDICFYSWNLQGITDALIEAYNQRVRIRFIYDCEHNQYQVTRLKNAGITVIDNTYGNNDGQGNQHNKFAIFDARDNTYVFDDWVWTGSLNMTDYSEYGVNAFQNVIEIQDQALARAYTIEFEEMWGSDTNSPDASSSRFGPNKMDNTPHKFIINDKHVEMYMCPSDQVTSKIINAITSADSEIYFCILAFTRIDVKLAMLDRFSTVEGFRIRGVFDSQPDPNTQYYSMNGTGDYAWDPPADVWLDDEWGILHHKYMIIDAEHPAADPIVITGSQNWSTSAETKNNENTLIIHDAAIANQYLQEFAERYHAAGGTGDFFSSVAEDDFISIPNSIKLEQNYPNPFNPETVIGFQLLDFCEVSLKIYDVLGQEVRTVLNENKPAGYYSVAWDGKDDFGKPVSSGVYFYRLKSRAEGFVKKMVLLR